MKIRRSFLVLALLLIATRFVLAKIGGEDATHFIAGNPTSFAELVLGAIYVFVHLVTVVLAPILILGTGIDWAIKKAAARRIA